jgi:LysM repeat protein
MRLSRICCLIALLLSGCGGRFAHFGESTRERDLAFDEMRVEIADLRHALQAHKTDLSLLQERLQEQEARTDEASRNRYFSESLSTRLALIEKKVPLLERQHEKFASDLSALKKGYGQSGSNFHAIEEKLGLLQAQLDQCSSRLKDIQQLKTTLTQVSKAIGDKESSSSKKYRVKSGDSLDKIAKQNRSSVAEIKRLNDLSSDKIVVGQELVLSVDE